MTTQCVQVKLELGHKAVIRTKPTSEGFTHDWTVFVRGPEGSNIQHFVEKVSFLLHESFPRPKRIVKEPPYQVSESGYAGFLLPIEVYFKNKEEPKRVRFEYDLFLHIEGPPVNHIRCEKLTFQNPTEDFRRKLIKAGGVGILSPDGGTILGQQPDAVGGSGEVVTITSNPPAASAAPASKSSSSKVSPEPVKKPRSITSSKGNVPPPTPASRQITTPEPEPFVALFGPPIKTNKASPDSRKIKDGNAKGSSGKSTKGGSSRAMPSSSSTAPVMAARKEPKSTTKQSSSSRESKQTSSPDNVNNNLVPESAKSIGRVATPSPVRPASEISGEKKRKRVSGSSTASTVGSGKSKVRDVKKKKKEPTEKKERLKQSKSEKKSSKSSKTVDDEPKISSKTSTEIPPPPTTPTISTNTKMDAECSRVSSPDTSPESSISFSSLHISGKRGPLGTLMAELDDDDDDELVSPLSSDPPSPPRFSSKPIEPQPPTPTPTPTPIPKVEKEKKSKSKHKNHADNKQVDVPRKKKENESCDLNVLYQQICTLQNKERLQQIADVIEETGLYTVTSSTLDFDLRVLDIETIRKLKSLVPAF